MDKIINKIVKIIKEAKDAKAAKTLIYGLKKDMAHGMIKILYPMMVILILNMKKHPQVVDFHIL